MPFLPVKNYGEEVDFILITADGYVDHPSFGHAIISRIIEDKGFTIGIIPQPMCDSDYLEFGTPKCGVFISGGVVDSMVNNYTVAKRKRTRDEYSEGGVFGKRPDRVLTVYSQKARELFPDSAIVIGGLEASLRRFAHYDYWNDTVMPSLLLDTDADFLMYGMGELPLIEILSRVKKGIPLGKIRDVDGIVYRSKFDDLSKSVKEKMQTGKIKFCPSFEDVKSNKKQYVKAFKLQAQHGYTISQKHGNEYIIANPMARPLTTDEMDYVYDLPYMREYHPMYKGGIPALKEVKFSIVSHRGCFGECNYCAIAYHQGSIIQKRSKESIIREAEILIKKPDFKGYIHDLGGPTANFRNVACDVQEKTNKKCGTKHCIGNEACKNLKVDHNEYLDILRSVRQLKGIKKVFIRSGIRYDYVMYDKSEEFLREIIEHHISGQLKVAPEHCSPSVLKAMNKPSFKIYKAFREKYMRINKEVGKEQYLVPYLISSHPGCTLKDAIQLATYLKSIHHTPEQVQDFYPTPSTKSTTMYYTEINPDTMQPIFVPKTREEKAMQRALLQFKLPKNHALVKEALIKENRKDLIGYGSGCLIKPFVSGEKVKSTSKPTKNLGGKPKKHTKYKKFKKKK